MCVGPHRAKRITRSAGGCPSDVMFTGRWSGVPFSRRASCSSRLRRSKSIMFLAPRIVTSDYTRHALLALAGRGAAIVRPSQLGLFGGCSAAQTRAIDLVTPNTPTTHVACDATAKWLIDITVDHKYSVPLDNVCCESRYIELITC